MKKHRSEKNEDDLKKTSDTPSEELHEAVEIIEELSRRVRESERR